MRSRDYPYKPFDKDKLNKLFAALRSRGYMAKQNYTCCGSCGGYAITMEAVKAVQAGKRKKEDIRGCVFYHSQDNDGLQRSGKVYLAYGPMSSEELGDIGKSTEEAGQEIVELARELDIWTEWDGSGGTRILVDLTQPAVPTCIGEGI